MTDLSSPIYHDNDAARRHLEAIRWPDGPYCPPSRSGAGGIIRDPPAFSTLDYFVVWSTEGRPCAHPRGRGWPTRRLRALPGAFTLPRVNCLAGETLCAGA